MLRLKQKKDEKAAAAAASAPAATTTSAEAKTDSTENSSEEKKEIKLFDAIGGVALNNANGAKSGRQITPGELRIQRGLYFVPYYFLCYYKIL